LRNNQVGALWAPAVSCFGRGPRRLEARRPLRLAAAGLALMGAGVFLTTTSSAAAGTNPFGPLTEVAVPGTFGDFYGVSCADAIDCTAVGQDNNSQPVYATETNGTWAAGIEVTGPGSGGQFNSVSCTDAADCTAVGALDYGFGPPIYATETNGTWGPFTVFTVPAALGSSGYFTGVSCTDATDCTAVGADGNGQPFSVTETHGVWGPAATEVPVPIPGGDSNLGSQFSSVSCSNALDCTAVGYEQFDDGFFQYFEPIYATETNGIWGPATEVPVGGFPARGEFAGVSCANATNCTAVGHNLTGGPGFYVTETNGVWGFPTAIPGTPFSPYGVSCTNATNCTAVGSDGEPFYATETNGVWDPGAEITAMGGGGQFNAVSCADAMHCAAVGQDNNDEPIATITPALPTGGSQVHAVIQVETSPAYAGDSVNISSSQLQASCGGQILFETLQRGSTVAPHRTFNSITVVLDDDGNVTVVVDGANCAAGTDLIEADLTGAPYLTATTSLVVEPPQVTPAGVSANPSTEVETGNSPSSGESDVYTVFYVETNPVYAEQPVQISSPQLDSRCGGGWRWEPGSGTAIDQTSGTTVATGTLDDDGNATFVFKGASCAAGPSAVIADVEAGSHPTYVTTFTVTAPVPTLASVKAGGSVGSHKAAKHHRHHKGSGGGGSGSGGSAPAMTVTASPNALVETGSGTQSGQATLNVVKSDDQGGTSGPPATTGFVAEGCCEITYAITVSNSGTAPISGVTVYDDLADNNINLYEDSFTAVGTGGASGFTPTATGTHFVNIDDTVDLPAGSSITYTVVAGVDNQCTTLSNTVTLTPPGGSVISPTSNLSATDTDSLGGCV